MRQIKAIHLLVAWGIAILILVLLGGCAYQQPSISMAEFNPQGLKFGPGKSMEDPDAALVGFGYRAMAPKEGFFDHAGLDCNVNFFREQLRKDTLIDEYWHVMCRYTWQKQLKGPLYAYIGTGGGLVEKGVELVGGCQGAFSQRIGLGLGMFLLSYGHESTFNLCHNPGQDYWSIELVGAFEWLRENVF